MNKNIALVVGLVVGGFVLALVAVVGFIAWRAHQRALIIDEMTRSAQEILALNQGYQISGIQGASGEGRPFLPLTEPIEKLELPDPTLKSLKAAGVKTVGDLSAKTPDDLLRIPGIDHAAVQTVSEALSRPRSMNVSFVANSPIEKLELPAPIVQSLKNAGLKTIEEVAAKSEQQLGAVKGIDRPALTAIQTALSKWNVARSVSAICP